MVVAVVAVRMVQVPLHEVVRVISVRDRLMAAVRAMLVGLVVTSASVLRRAAGRVGRRHFQTMLLDSPGAGVVHMAVMQVVGMPVMLDRLVPALGTVLMRMVRMCRGHG